MKIVVFVNTNRKNNKIIQFVPFFKSFSCRTSRLEPSEPEPMALWLWHLQNNEAPALSKKIMWLRQCCRFRRFLTGSDFRKRPDPHQDPDLNKFSGNFFSETFLMKICCKKYLHKPTS
jgi:hypothetical protein